MWIISTSIFIILITYNVYLNSLNNRLYMTVFIIIYALELDNSLSNYTSQMLWQLSGYRIVMISCQRVLFPTDAKFFQLTLTIFFSEWSYFNTPPQRCIAGTWYSGVSAWDARIKGVFRGPPSGVPRPFWVMTSQINKLCYWSACAGPRNAYPVKKQNRVQKKRSKAIIGLTSC